MTISKTWYFHSYSYQNLQDEIKDDEEDENAVFINENEIDEEIGIEIDDISIAQFTGHSSCVYSIDIHPSNPKLYVSGGGDDRVGPYPFTLGIFMEI